MGNIISFSGIDGAGKSTQTKLLTEYLISKKKTFIVTEAMFTYFILKPLVSILRYITKSPNGGPVTRNKTNNLAKLWFILAFFDIWIGYLFKVQILRTKYDYIIADRIYLDMWANLLYYGYVPRIVYRTLIRLLPSSQIGFLFLVKPGTVRKREDDFPQSYYQEQSKIYKQLPKLVNIYVIDANGRPENTFDQIKEKLIDI